MKALILAGGSGTRFWPASRRRRPKQLLPLKGGVSFLRRTVNRLLPILEPSDIWICTGAVLAEEVMEQVPEVPRHQVLSEPVGRNTAPAIAWTLCSIAPADRDQVLVSLHSDHWIEDEDAFRASLLQAVEHASSNDAVLALGVKPRWAETGYGYMQLGEEIDAVNHVHRVSCFREKPDAETAEHFLASGDFVWNSGIFVFPIDTLLSRLRELTPRLMAGIEEISEAPSEIDRLYPELPSAAIDTAVMEKLDRLSTLVLDCGWSDVGSWEALAEILDCQDGNAVYGNAIALEASGNLLYSDGATIAVLGVDNLAVVVAGDAVLVMPKSRSQEVRRIVEEIQRRNLEDLP